MTDVRLENVRVAFGGNDVVRDVSFTVASGELAVLVGRSGSGKTSLLRTITGYAPVVAGRVRIGGEDVETGRLHAVVPPHSHGEPLAHAHWGGGLHGPKGIQCGASGQGDRKRDRPSLGERPLTGLCPRSGERDGVHPPSKLASGSLTILVLQRASH